MGPKPKDTAWVEGVPIPNHVQDTASGKIDDTSWELGHFLSLAVHGNPTILEVFAAPIDMLDEDGAGQRLRQLFPYVWNPRGVRDSFVGYAQNQRKKLFDNSPRTAKYATAYLRVLYQAYTLLTTDTLPIDMRDTDIVGELLKWRDGRFSLGEVVDTCKEWEARVQLAYPFCKQVPDLDKVNAYLLDIRKANWL